MGTGEGDLRLVVVVAAVVDVDVVVVVAAVVDDVVVAVVVASLVEAQPVGR